MLRTALAELRAHPGRFLAVGLAIVLGVGFAAATVVFTSSFDSALGRSMAAEVSRVDVVVTADRGSAQGSTVQGSVKPGSVDQVTPDLDKLRATRGVFSAEPAMRAYPGFTSATSRGAIALANIPVDPDRRWYSLASGRWPASGAELAVAQGTAKRNSWTLGSSITLGEAPDARTVTVVAILDTRISALTDATDTAYGTADLLSSLNGVQVGTADTAYLLVAPGFTPEQVAATITADSGGRLSARTSSDVTAEAVRDAGNGTSVIVGILLAFVSLAGLVAAMVVANTFTILITQRRRQIALLRCVGATGEQVRRSTLVEVAVVAVTGSVVGVVVGIVIGRLACAITGIDAADFRVPAGQLGLVGVIGVVVTLIAALAPVARATRIPPMAALRPVDGEERVRKVSAVRLGVGVLLVVAGGGLLAGGVHLGDLMIATAGGALTAIGVLVLLPWALPFVLAAFSGLGGLFGAHGRLATKNLLRNPGRSAATCTALVMGVGAIITLLVASASAQAGADQAVGAKYALDLQVGSRDDLPNSLPERLGRIEGMATTVAVTGTQVQLDGNDYLAYGPTATQFESVRNGGELSPGEIAVPGYLLGNGGLQPGETVTVRKGSFALSLTVAPRPISDDGALVMLSEDLRQLDPSAGVRAVWGKFAADADPNDVLGRVNPVLAPYAAVTVSGSGPLRASTADLLDTLVTIALALLGVTVVIAVVGIGNTLGLSVVERTRESALLRALGLRRGQLRSMLAIEAGLLALVAAVVGTFFGVLFGWAAVGAAFGQAEQSVVLSIPVGRVALVFVGAVLAGVIASVLPGRRAARATPTQALVDA
ncbi:putative ABC transport system permease protein [Nakamurella sp. UYEF19]|uniref:ABC transporter permease n=1 Tax=Nakamurella sp. UYEF19 TaxID=1756392 RepID=UPI0033926990